MELLQGEVISQDRGCAVQNEILTDCIFDTSVQTRGCQMQSGGWAKCASRQPIPERNTPLVIPYAGQAAGFGFANRSTVSGKQCALPYVLKYAPAHGTRDI